MTEASVMASGDSEKGLGVNLSDEQEEHFFETGGELPEGVEAEPEEKAEPEPEPEKPEPKEDDRTVPLQALHAERARRKEEAQARQQIQEKMSRMEQRFNQLVESLTPKPDPDLDPDAHLRNEIGEIKQTLSKQEQMAEYQRQQQAQQQQIVQLQNAVSAQETAFAKQHPDYADALDYVREVSRREMALSGMDAAQIEEQLTRQSYALAYSSIQNGTNPAQIIYETAKIRGYQPKKTASDTKIDTLAKGVEASKSLSSKSGGKTPELTLEALAEMSDEDFDKNWDKFFK